MKKHDAHRNRDVYVGYLDYRPHVQVENGAQIIAVYVSKRAAQHAYSDVRKARLVFDVRDRRQA